ncbi:MAG: DUF1553 domain-containing protein [Verrucomicrobiales bacterium]
MSRPILTFLSLLLLTKQSASAGERPIDFNSDIRPILSNACFRCHGPDPEKRKGGTSDSGGLRLDVRDAALADLGGYAAIVPGKHSASELIRRIISTDPDEVMPPREGGKPLSQADVETLQRWIDEGAPYARHWAYVEPADVTPPADISKPDWPTNAIDHFILKRLDQEGLRPMPEADRNALIRRVALDLTGLPPTPEEVEAFVNDTAPDAYEKVVDSMLRKESFGEHWARSWLDLARYADSAGYADDPERTIWAYRDYVIRAFNENKPFDTFTVEQLAGDLLPNPTQEQLIATAFHRNTQTNNEGGTSDEEYRNVAVIDRVNTTLAVWMGTTMACAQCHTHKYDPITQKEYFEVFAIFNSSADADRRDESPLINVATPEFTRQKAAKEEELQRLRDRLDQPGAEVLQAFDQWQKTALDTAPVWTPLHPTSMTAASGATFSVLDDQSILVSGAQAETDTYTVTTPALANGITALRIEAIPDPSLGGGNGPGRKGNFVLNEFEITETADKQAPLNGQFVRIDLKGDNKMIHVAEVEVFSNDTNIARNGKATQSSTYLSANASLAIDGDTNGDYEGKSVTHTAANGKDPWWEVDLGAEFPVDRVAVWNRTDNNLQSRLDGYTLTIFNADRKVVWTETFAAAPEKSQTVAFDGTRKVLLQNASATFSQDKFGVALAIDGDDGGHSGWAVGGQTGKRHAAVFETVAPAAKAAGSTLTFVMKQTYGEHALGRFRLSATTAPAPVREFPIDVTAALAKDEESRTADEARALMDYFVRIEPSLQELRTQIAQLETEVAEMKPPTTVPVMRELPESERRKSYVQVRGNYLVTGEEVRPGLPVELHAASKIEGEPTRLDLAKWLVEPSNPLTARVTANRFWESIFGIGLVSTSEEFGSQGEPPSHPELLDWMALELVRSKWDTKRFLKMLVMSATYRQSSTVTPELIERDPQNRLLARGPRFRVSAEMVRDQSLFAAGLLSDKVYGPPVRPPQPQSGLAAAFGGGIDWKTSSGEDKYRRGIYTSWRRSNPYPSMTTFDAPNREVCIIRRDRTNTPLQALVTLNDPVYMEAAQGLARRLLALNKPTDATIDAAYMICLSRNATERERDAIKSLLERTKTRLANDSERAMQLATDPLGPAPDGADIAELAAWSVVGNVILNLDEFFLKR